MKQRLQGWEMKTLAQVGRATLISSMAASIPTYQASSLLLSKQVCSKLDALNHKFWWGFKEENKKNGVCLKSWDSICTPKAAGGLGLKKTEDMNQALVEKLTWDVASNADNCWVEIFKKKNVRGRNFMKMPMPKSITWTSQSIFECRDVIKNGLCHKRGNGWNTWILEDS